MFRQDLLPSPLASPTGGNMLQQKTAQFMAAIFGMFIIATAQVHAQDATPKLANVVILATGGTIAGSGASSTTTIGYTAATVGVQQLIQAVPELTKVASVTGEQVFQIASESMTNEHWLTLGKRVNTLLAQKNVDGIVITHGTDTLEETAYFLNLVVKSRKPVVLVGAMRPSTALSADGPINLYNAVLLAGSQDAVGKGVMIAMGDQIHGARDVSKTNTSTPDSFKTPELGMMGYIQGGKPYFYHVSTRKHTADTEFDISNLNVLPQVDIVYGYANMNPVALDAFVAAGAKGIIHAGTGDGSLAAKIKPALSAARQKGTIIVRSSRVGQGIVARNGEANDDQLDFVVSDTLNPQKARILLMLALTKTNSTKDIQRMFYAY
jgi:L-asparaginase/glutamin-(asparagin-)ase